MQFQFGECTQSLEGSGYSAEPAMLSLFEQLEIIQKERQDHRLFIKRGQVAKGEGARYDEII